MGGFTFPEGMAGTKRIKHAIDALQLMPDVLIQVVLLRQLSVENKGSGIYKGISYHTIMPGLTRNGFMVLFPLLYMKTFFYLRKCRLKSAVNIIYHYGPVSHENLIPLVLAKIMGYKIVFDIVEDYNVIVTTSKSIFFKLRNLGIQQFLLVMKQIASGLIVISSYLEAAYKNSLSKNIKIHYRPISIDMAKFQDSQRPSIKNKSEITFFYAGSFGRKDGVLDLIDAFDGLAAKRDNVCLVLTGRGTEASMSEFFSRVERSPFKDRIDYKGYLDEAAYYDVLHCVDIHCMTRIGHDYAHAGFPFKLGEYLATGKPVIASRVSDIERFLEHGKSAMIVTPGSCKDIEAAAAFLIDNPDKALQIGAQGRAAAFANFDHKIQGEKLFQFLKRL